MIDLPVTIYVEYKGLSSITLVAEQQKDFIAQVLKKTESKNKIIVEKPENMENKKLENFWEVKCIQCQTSINEKSELILNSIWKKKKPDLSAEELSFETSDPNGKISPWKIEFAEKKPFLVHTGEQVKIFYNPSPGIIIQNFGKSLKNARRGETVRVELGNWFAKGSQTNFHGIIETTVTASGEVEYADKQ